MIGPFAYEGEDIEDFPNVSVVYNYKIKVVMATILVVLLFVSIYYLQNKMWEYQDKYIDSLRSITYMEEKLTEVTVRNMELQGKIELLEQQPVKETD